MIDARYAARQVHDVPLFNVCTTSLILWCSSLRPKYLSMLKHRKWRMSPSQITLVEIQKARTLGTRNSRLFKARTIYTRICICIHPCIIMTLADTLERRLCMQYIQAIRVLKFARIFVLVIVCLLEHVRVTIKDRKNTYLPHVNSNLTTFTDHARRIFSFLPCSEVG